MKTIRSATSRAKLISCVTMTIVMSSAASPLMTLSTSAVSSGSSALVGSSKKTIRGFIASARAMLARCCWPPESWQGTFSSLPVSPILARSARACSSTSARSRFCTQMGASMTLRSTEKCGKRL